VRTNSPHPTLTERGPKNGVRSPLGNGTFEFSKGGVQRYPYKLLSGGEKAVFDLLLDFAVKRQTFNDTVYCVDEPDYTSTQRSSVFYLLGWLGLIALVIAVLQATVVVAIVVAAVVGAALLFFVVFVMIDAPRRAHEKRRLEQCVHTLEAVSVGGVPLEDGATVRASPPPSFKLHYHNVGSEASRNVVARVSVGELRSLSSSMRQRGG